MDRLTLAEALETGRLEAFAAQAEAEGIGPADRSQFDKMVAKIVSPTKPATTPRPRSTSDESN